MKTFFTFFILLFFFTAIRVMALPKLNSLPSARATIFLDFDGDNASYGMWNQGIAINAVPSGMNDVQINEIFSRVSEDYRPFNINITTDSTVFEAAPVAQRVRVIITRTSAWYQGVGGVAYVGSFTWGDDTPAFVFADRLGPNNPKYIAESCSHESGHTLGLSHQSKYDGNCALTATYNDGVGTGETGWAPIMGNSYYKNHTSWNNGATPGGCTSLQDNLTIITTKNGFGYRADDHSNDAAVNPSKIIVGSAPFSASGIITTPADQDVFELDLKQPGAIHLNATPFSVGANDNGADLDVKVSLLNANMQTIRVYDPSEILSVVIDTTLAMGRYYLVLKGAGNQNSTEYASLGSYTINGSFRYSFVLPVNEIILSGKTETGKHHLSWDIKAGAPVKLVDIESSTDGSHFNSFANVDKDSYKFSYDPAVKAGVFYRLKITSKLDESFYSNVIFLNQANAATRSFTVTTLVHDAIVVNALKNYSYLLSDASGRSVAHGTSQAGKQSISISNHPNGIYVMQIISQNERQSERIIKQ